MMHPALLKGSGWSYSPRLRDLFAAKSWGIDPDHFDNLSKSAQKDIVAAEFVEKRIQVINDYEIQRKRKPPKRPKGK